MPEINLSKRKAAPPAADLLAKATGQVPARQAPPPAAKLPPGVTGNPPLPAAQVVSSIAPHSLTEMERESLEAIGWTPDIPIPAGAADLVQAAVQGRLSEQITLPIDPKTPPLKVDVKDINNLTTAEQERFRQAMKTAASQEAAAKAAEAQQAAAAARAAANEQRLPGFNAAQQAAAAASQPKPADHLIEVEDDRGAAKPSPAAAPSPPPPPTAPATGTETGLHAGPDECPHCGWDRKQTDIPEPPQADKLAFLHAMLGQQPYLRAYPLFGGAVVATFRTLTPREIDAIYKQAYRDQEQGKLPTAIDFWNQINRYRLFLQLTRFTGDGRGGFLHDLPDGLSHEANPTATTVWDRPEYAAEIEEGGTLLPLIETWLITHVLKTEPVFRTVAAACNQFNRLTAKMEALADNTDFWRPTEPPS